mmetsp:Transcript_21779/g.24453  ORF Transcript_21779/g.24453 Transcript_21779/m.24453 type:complete len:796 (+) Transcript_21779:148-2535(+)
MFLFNSKKFTLLVMKRQYLLRDKIAIGGVFSALLITQQQRQEEEQLTEESQHLQIGKDAALPSIDGMFSSPFSITACDYSYPIRRTEINMEECSTKKKLRSTYSVKWKVPLGEGGFGAVYLGKEKKTGELYAVKKISKRFTCDSSFQREMDAFLHIRQLGGHPNICGLKENFEEGSYYYLILDLVQGGEMFDHLISDGAYSEADAARLVKEVGSALNFLHGIGLVHTDLKPENLMLSSKHSSDAVIKVVDFGCAEVIDRNSPFYDTKGNQSFANTPGYSPPEMIDTVRKSSHLEPSVDMFSMGVIIYIMLTGVHPFDVSGQSTDEEMNQKVLSGKFPPLRNSHITAHLSPSAIDLIEKLMVYNPKNRMTALEMLNHPWIRGETANKGKIANSHKKLKDFRKYKSALQAKVFASMVQISDDSEDDDVTKKTSLIQRSFQMIDSEHRGYITTGDLKKLNPKKAQKNAEEGQSAEDSHLSLSGFSDLLSENMKNIFLPAGHVIFKEGDEGDKIYFINSGRVEVSTKEGFKAITEQGDFFGEGALLSKQGRRSANIKCITPLDAIEISKEYFEKYLTGGASTEISIREKDRLRKQNRAKAILSLQHRLEDDIIEKGDYIYEQGEEGKDIFLVEDGVVDFCVDGHHVYTTQPGELFGEYAAIFGRPRNTSAKCVSNHCKIQIMEPNDFESIMKSNPSVREGLSEVVLRREFRKALVFATKKPFPTKEEELKEAFNAIDHDESGEIDLSEIDELLRKMDKTFTDNDIAQILNSLDLDGGGNIDWEEFKRIFGMSGTKFVKV